MKLKDLPNDEKPRERLLKYGVDNLSNEDLISILLRTGSKNQNVKQTSSEILKLIKNINSLKDLGIRELTNIKGVGNAKAFTILAAIELGKRVNNLVIENMVVLKNTDIVHNYFASLIGFNKQENLLVILLDNKKRLISYQKMFKGTDSESVVSIKEILNYAIRERASGIIIMHNHPSGMIQPSEADIDLTNNLIMSGRLMGIPLLDHIITNGKNYYSFFKEFKNEV